jgi:biopolymer transport protein ExbD
MTNLRETRRDKQRDESSKEASMDMTPMIDVVFLLIIFFLCIDFKVLEAKLPAHLPKDIGSRDKPVEPESPLRVRIVCDARGEKVPRPTGDSYRLDGHVVHFDIGATRDIRSLTDLGTELKTLRDDPNRMVKDPAHPGRMKLVRVVVEPGPGVVYGDVARCVDSIAASGFTEISFGGGLGRR